MTVIVQRGPLKKRRIKVTPLRILIVASLLGAILLGGGSWLLRRWAPDRGRYPIQGVTVSAGSGTVHWPSVKVKGADFAYLLASSGSAQRDPSFTTNLTGAREAGLRYGAIHRYMICTGATAQATTFIATVPRDPDMLPPVVALDRLDGCPRPSRDRLLAELNTFLNQIEAHSGKPAILRITREVEAAYDLSAGINRTLWLEGAFFSPGYATRPWVMWTASTWRRVPGIDGTLEWDVVRP
ncbi:MAG: glycoside hydrolase family 25 [Sphingobium sp.]|nr:glycoside hydrolase family 25 [Sphingobium sp.]